MSVLWLNGRCPAIPKIAAGKLNELAAKIKPIAKKDGLHFEVNPVDLVNSFIWETIFGDVVKYPLYEVARIETYHTCGYVGLFKPSVEEVLAQIPKRVIKLTDCFEVLADDTVGCYSEGDGHRTVTVLYTKTEPYTNAWFKRIA